MLTMRPYLACHVKYAASCESDLKPALLLLFLLSGVRTKIAYVTFTCRILVRPLHASFHNFMHARRVKRV